MDAPSWLDASTAWYNTHAGTFAQEANACNPAQDRDTFLSLLPAEGTVLDIGCGSGRDLAAFSTAGRSVQGWEPADRLAAIARRDTGQEVLRRSLDDLPGSGPWAGVWAMAVLLHTPLADWPRHLRAIADSLTPGGIACIAVKDGHSEGQDARGRPFAALDLSGLNAICPPMDHVAWWITTVDATESSGRIVSWHTVWARRLS